MTLTVAIPPEFYVPESNFYFTGKPGSRLNLDKVYYPDSEHVHRTHPGNRILKYSPAYAAQMTTDTPDYETIVANEVEHKAETLDLLTAMVRGEGEKYRHFDAKQMFAELAQHPVRGIVSSQHFLVMRDFSEEPRADPHCTETTTSYDFQFGFVEKWAHEKSHLLPMIEMDANVWKLLEKYGIGREWKEAFCTRFMQRRECSGHDDVHQLVESARNFATLAFPSNDALADLPANEKHALATHAREDKTLFDMHPERKEEMLQEIVELIHIIGLIQDKAQQQARASGATPKEIHAIGEAVTYLAEISAHSIFRDFSPKDAALRQPVTVTIPAIGEQPAVTCTQSVAEAFDHLQIQIPPRVVRKTEVEADARGFDAIRANCKDWLGNIYEEIHRITKLPMRELDRPLHAYPENDPMAAVPQTKVSLASIVARMTEARAAMRQHEKHFGDEGNSPRR